MPDKIDTLYNALKADGAVTKSREHFRSKMLASGAEGYKNRKQLYDALKADGAVSSPTYEDFAARLGLHAVKPATGKQILKSRPTMQIVDGKSVPAKQRNVQPAAKSGTNPLTQASQRYWQAQAELDKPVVQSADTKSYAPGELLQKPKSNRELIDAAKKQLRATRPQPQPQPWKFSEQAHSSNQNEPSLAGAIDSATEAVKRQHTSLTAQLKHNSPLPMTKDEVAARAEDEVAHEDYVATQKTIDDELKEANAERAKLEQELERRGQELEKKNNTLQNNMSLGGFAMISSNQATNAERKTDAEYQQHQAALDQIDKRIKTLEAAKNKTGFWGGVADALSDTSTYTFGLTDMRNAAVMHAVSKKIEKGQPLTEAEKRMLKNAANNNDIQAKYGDRISAMYRFGQISGYALPFVAEFVATGGGYGAVQAGIKGAAKSVAASAAKAAPKMLGNKAAQWMIRNTGVLAGDIAAGALMANTTGAAKTGADILKRHMGEVQSDGKGGYKFVGGKSLGRSIYEGEVAQTLEYYTEMLGAHFNIGSRLAKGAEKIGLSKMSKAINYLGSNKWLSKAGVQDYPSEVLEEESNIILNSLLVGDNKLSDLYDKKTQADIWGGMALSIGLMNVPKYAGTGYQSAQYYRYKHKTDTSDKLASYRLTPDKWTPIKEQIDGATNEEIKDVVYDIISNNDLHQQQKSAALDYVKNLVTMRGYNMALTNSVNDEVANEEKGEVPVDHSADKAYTDGYTAQDVTARKDVKMRHDELRGELSFATDEDFKILDDSPTVAKEAVMSRDDWSDEQKEQALAYVNAKEALAGVVDRINEDADYMAAQQREELKQKQHTDGALHPATLKEKDEEGHDKEVFIIDGHVQMTEDGSMVDAENSDKSVVVYNTATDKREIIDPTSDTGISTLGEVKTAEQQEAEIEDVRQRYVQTMMDEVQGTVRLAPGQQVVLQTGEDATVMATDGDNITVALGDGTQTNVSLADLQRISDEKAMEDYKQRHGIQYEQQPAEAQPVPQTIQEEPIPAQTEQPTETAAQEQAAVEPMPMKEDGEEDYYATTPERAHQYIFNEAELPRDVANGVVRAQYDDATKALAKAKAAPQPKVGKSIQQYKQAVAKRQEKIDEAQRAVDYWQRVREIQNDIYRQEAAERAATNAVAHDEAVAQAQADFEARKAAEVERKVVGNENPMPAITEKWKTANKIDGHRDEIMLPNGEPLKGHYVLHESGASSPSHNSENWAKTDGFPMDANDNSVNDRDYERDRDAQRHTEGIAQQYDQRALQNVPVVSNDGVVLSGNGRTIAGEIAARNNTDGAYVDYLKEYAHKFGFTPEQVEGMQHPRVSFVPDDAMPYTAETFAKFNQQEMKSQNKTEQAVKLGKTVSDDSFGRIVRTINGYDTLGDFYNDPQASLGAVNDLHGAGVIPQAQMAEMVDGGRGNQRLSAVGKEFLENMLIGKAFDGNPDVVRMLTEIPSMRQSVITALGEISDNIALGDGWALQNELADAVKLVYDARSDGDYQHGDIVSVYARQGRLFADPDELQTVADFNNMTMLMLADVLNDKRVTMLKTTLALYNKDARDSANGVQDIFAGGVVSREEILRNVIKFINNAQRKELEAAHAAAVERRKTEGVQQDGTPPQVDEAERRVADDGGDTAAERGQSKSNTLSQENTEPRQIKLSDPRTMSDEEKQRRGEMLRDAYAIEVTVGQIVATEEVSARRAAEKWWDENVSEPAFYDTEAGEVEINRNSVESSLAHRYGQMKLDAITSLIDGFENAVYLGTMPDSRERGVVDHYFAYPIMYNGERCYVFCRAMQDANKNRLYVHEVFVAERIKKGDTFQTAASKPHGGISLYRDILANVLDASKEEVWSASEEQNEQSVTDNTLRAEDKSDNPTTPNGNVSNSSAGKVTESSEELQGKEDKFTPAPMEDGEDYVDYAARVTAVKAQHDAIKAAENATDTNPTDGQKKAGNYKKGHVQIGAFDISVEQPKGSVRRGKDADGKEWESKMNNTYGYFRGTEGVDGDHIDVFLSNDIDGWNGRKVFVVDQYNPDGTFDEHKVMLGFNDADDAKSNYLANYEKGWENGRRIDVSTTNLEDFEKWISSSHRKTKPFAEYKGVKIDEVQSPSEKYQPIIRATFNKVKREQGIIEPIAEKKRKPFTVFDVTVKEPRRPMFGGVYHDGGMAVATNGVVMFAHKEAYDEAKEGKIITSKGDVIEGKFPDWRGAIPKETIPTGLQTEPLLEFVNGALARMKAEKAKKYEVDGALAYIKFQDGNVVCCQLADLQKMLRAAKSIGADDLRLGTDKEFLVAESPAGKAIVIIQGEEKARYNAGYNNFAYEAPTVKGEEEVSDGALDNPYPSEKEVKQESKDDNTGNVILKQLSDVHLSADTESQRLATDAALEGLKRAGVPVEVVSDEQAAAMLGEQKGVELSAKQKRALETASPAMQDHHTVVSSADGTKVLKGLDNAIEEDLKITDHVQFMKTPSGTLYGWTVGGKIYLTKDGLNPNTPIHEYTHLWARAMKERNKEGWQSVKELLRDTPVWDEVLKDKNYQDILDDEDAIASEALSRISGQKNAEKMEAEARKMIDEAKDYVDKAKAISLLERMKSALKKFWNWVGKDLFGIKKFSSVDEITDRVLYDLTNGTDLKGVASEKVEKQQVSTGSEEERAIIDRAKESGTYMKAPNGEPTRLTEKQWAQVRTKAFKSWFGDWEKAARIEKLRKSEPVVITGEEYKGKYELNRDSAKAWIKDNLRGEYTIADTGEKIAIGRKGINKVTSHSMGNEAHLKSLIAVPKMLEQSVFITEEKADKLNAQYPTYRYYVVGLNIAGVDNTAKLTIGVDENGNKYYDHALTEIEKGKLLDQINGQAVDNGFMSTGAEPNPSVTDSKDTKLVSILQTNSSKFVDENGEPMVFYHNTNNNFSVFDSKRNGTHTDAGWLGDGFYFYGDENEGSGYGNIKMGVFLNVRDPYYATSEENNQLAEANSRDMSVDFRENLEEEGYDGVFYNGDLRQEAVVFEPNQIKSATDNNGEFSQESDDIRYRESKGSSERTLVGIHNISADKLSKAIKQGGLANPSVAVIDISKQQHTGYGEISLIMPSDKINKRTGKNAGTFEGDAWTPMYPSVERQMSREGSLVMEHDIKALPNEMQSEVRNALNRWLDNGSDTDLSYLYLFQQGKAPKMATVKPKYSNEVYKSLRDIMFGVDSVYNLTKGEVKNLVELYVQTELNGDIDEYNKANERRIAKYKDAIESGRTNSMYYKIAERNLEEVKKYGYPLSSLKTFADDVQRDKTKQGSKNVQKTLNAASQIIKDAGLEEDFRNWVEGLNNRYQTKEVIFDGFTPTGKRRYIPNTLENVSKLMKKQGRQASTGLGVSFSNFAASVMKANGSLANIRKKKSKLTNEHKDIENFEEKWKEVYFDLAMKLQPNASTFDDYGFTRLQEAALEADPQAFLSKEYGVTLSKEDVRKLKQMVKAIQEERPAMYFETKFERPVTLNEFSKAVVPEDLSDDLQKTLRDNGIEIFTYKRGDAEDRQKATQEAAYSSDDIRFRQEERAARELAEVNERFNEELQKQIDGTLPAGHVYQLGMPGEILLSTGIPNLPIQMNAKRLQAKATSYGHDFDLSEVKDLVNVLQHPLALFSYGDKTKAQNIIVSLQKDGNNFIVGLSLNPSVGGHKLEINSIRNVFPKKNAEWLNWISQGKALYIDKEKVQNLIDQQRTILADVDYLDLDSAAKILKDFQNPTIDGKNHIALSENTLPAEPSHDREAMRNEAVQLSDKLHTPIKIVEDVKDITHSNAEVERRKRNSKGWYDVRTGEVVVVLPNNRDVEDVAATVMHETVAHKGLRELVGEEHYDEFLDEVYEHLRGDLKQGIDAEAGRAFVDDSTKNGERAKSYEQHRRTAVDELFGDMAEKPFEEFSEGERTLWQKLKEVVRKLLDKFLESLKLPRWFELGDNELRYMLWRSKERLERGTEHPIDFARDMVMRDELGLSDAARMRMGDTPDTFKARQRRAVEEKGIVMPGLNEAEVKVVDVPRHSFTGTGKDVLKAAEEWARKNIVGTHTAINSQGKQFEYEIGNKSVGKYVSSSSVQKSHNLGIHLSVLKRLPEVIQTSIEAEIHPDYTKNDSRERTVDSLVNVNSLIHRFYGAVDIDGKIYRVKTTIREFGDANLNAKAHNYEVTKIELIEAPSTYGLEANHEHLAMTSASSISVAKLLKDVEKSYDSGKKVLDESRKSDEDTAVYRIDNDDATPRANARAAYERMVSSAKNQFTEAVQDSMLSLKNLYKAILDAEGKSKSIEEVAAFENAYLAENRMASMSEAQIGVWHKDYMEPLIKEVSRLAPDKMAYEELTDYMMAKHGLERNEVLARRDAERAASEKYDARIAELDKVHQDAPLDQAITDTLDEAKRARQDFLNSETMANRERDYAGLTALTGKEEVADAEVEARRMVDDYEQAHETDALWKAVNAATRSSLYKIAESGMMSADRHRQVRDMFEYYIPLQGFDAKVAEDMYAYMGSDGTLGYGTPIRSAKGRKSKADDPIATIQMNGEAAIRQGNRNVMKQRFLNFVQAHPSDLVSVSDVWLRYNDVTGEWEQTYDADLKEDDRPEDVERKVRDFEERMEQLAKSAPDHYKRGGDLLNVPYRVLRSSNERQHQVLVQRGGKSYVLTINGSPRAAQALNGLTNPDIETEGIFGKAMNIGAKINRLLSSFYTTRNPEFVISNYIRDAFYSNSMMWVKEAPNYAMKFHKNFGKLNPAMMGKMFAEWESGSLREKVLQGGTGEIAYIRRMFYDFMMNGGETGWTNLRDIERHKRDLEKSLKLERSASRRAWKALGGCFDLMNRAVENNARFAAYMTSREMGRSVERSIWDAKEVSVNFNKKGAGDKFLTAKNQTLLGQIGAATGGLGRGLFLFWNASTQGLQNIGKQAKRHPAKFAGLATTLFVLGAVAPLIAEMLSGGDDDDKDSYYNLPEYVRRSNLVFRWSGGMPWITLPLPIEFRSIYGMGELATGMLTGKEHYSNEEFAKQFTSQMSQVLPLDFMEGGGGWHAFVPSSIKPFIEAQGNTSWTGLPIYRDNKFNPYAPQWKRAYDSANQQIVTATKWLNEVTGGDDATQGFIDWNPARIEYMLKGYLGGYFTMYDRLQKAAETAFGDRKFEWRNMPVASRVLKNGDERTAVRKLTNEYFNLLDEYKRTEARLKGYKKLVDEGGEDALKYAERIDYLHNSEEYRHYLLMDYYKPLIDTYYDMGKEAEGSERQRIKQEENALRREFVDLIHAVDEGKEIDLDATILQMLEDKARSGDVEVQKKAVSVAKNKYYERDGGKPTGFTQ